MDDGIIIGIIIFLILFFFFAIVIIAIARSDTPANNESVTTQVGGFLAACTTVPCNGEFLCSGDSFTCKLGPGAVCNDAADCAVGLICSGICATGPTGMLNDLCPCVNIVGTQDVFLCTAVVGQSLTICKGDAFANCTTDEDCANGFCDLSAFPVPVCAPGLPFGFPCTYDSQCNQLVSSHCSAGFCQPLNQTTGQLNASCAGACVTWTGAGCDGDTTCVCTSGNNVPGICTAFTQGILAPCSLSLACGEGLECLNATGGACNPLLNNCVCSFPYDDPNVQLPGGVCIGGMSGLNNTCYNDTGLGCSNGSSCASTLCGGSSVLAAYIFSGVNGANSGTALIGATGTQVVTANTGPPGIITPYRMFAYSQFSGGEYDNIWLVDHTQGLNVMSYMPSTQTVLVNWINLLPSVTVTTGPGFTMTQTLIDVAFNNQRSALTTNWLVAYEETIVSNTGTVSSNVVYAGPDLNTLTPFNVQTGSGLPGTQYTTSGVPLTIQYIDLSLANDVSAGNDVLISTGGTIYLKAAAAVKYSVGIITGGARNGQTMTGVTGPATFYYDVEENSSGPGAPSCPGVGNSPVQCPSLNNIAFVANYSGFNNILQFSGNVAGVVTPTDRFGAVQYQVFDFSVPFTQGGMLNTAVMTLSNVYNGSTFVDTVVTATTGTAVPLPYRVDSTARSCSSALAYYVVSVGSCTSM